jgi:hypothetical protein
MATTQKPIPEREQGIRGLSSVDAQRADLYLGRNVIVPPKHLMAGTHAMETARSIEIAREHLDESASSVEGSPHLVSADRVASAIVLTTTSVTDKYAFAFDIDGVLIRGGRAIPEAIEAMKVLNGQNQFGIKMLAPS